MRGEPMREKRKSVSFQAQTLPLHIFLYTLLIISCEDSDINKTANSVTRSYTLQSAQNKESSYLFESVQVEAESGLRSGVRITSALPGFSGTGYITGFLPDQSSSLDALELIIAVKNSGAYNLFVGYRSPAKKQTMIAVNHGAPFPIILHPSLTFREMTARKIMLHQGINTLRFFQGWGYFDLDYVRVETAISTNIYETVAQELVTPEASPEARAIYRYLRSIYGTTTLSGQYHPLDTNESRNMTPLDKIYRTTGQYPAVGGFDFIFYSPESRWQPDLSVPRALEWATRWNGVVTFCWHWLVRGKNEKSPTFWARNANFDIRKAIIPGQSEYYEAIYDMDIIADELKRFQNAGVPVLFRPFHEADGTHFWWGSQNGNAVTKLYRIMHDRYTNFHQLNNLIWVWNSESEDLYPGDDYVDIISTDIYNTARDMDPACHRFNKLYQLVKGRKMIALAENGPLPDPNRMQKLDCPWLFFNTWSGDFIADDLYTTDAQWRYVYQHPWITNLNKLPDFLNFLKGAN